MEQIDVRPPEVIELEALAIDAGVEFPLALARAKVAPSTFWRWRAGVTDPHTKTLRRIKSAIVELQAEAA